MMSGTAASIALIPTHLNSRPKTSSCITSEAACTQKSMVAKKRVR